jgi:hypothetical protein
MARLLLTLPGGLENETSEKEEGNMVAFTLKSVAVGLVGVLAAGGVASAETKSGRGAQAPQHELRLAQNQVVVPAQPAPPPAAPPVQAAPQPVEVVPPHKTVVTDDHPQNFMATIAESTFFGALTGALVGAAVYFLDDPRRDPQHIYLWGAGGAVVGLGIGLINVAANEDHRERAVSDVGSSKREGVQARSLGFRLTAARF